MQKLKHQFRNLQKIIIYEEEHTPLLQKQRLDTNDWVPTIGLPLYVLEEINLYYSWNWIFLRYVKHNKSEVWSILCIIYIIC